MLLSNGRIIDQLYSMIFQNAAHVQKASSKKSRSRGYSRGNKYSCKGFVVDVLEGGKSQSGFGLPKINNNKNLMKS